MAQPPLPPSTTIQQRETKYSPPKPKGAFQNSVHSAAEVRKYFDKLTATLLERTYRSLITNPDHVLRCLRGKENAECPGTVETYLLNRLLKDLLPQNVVRDEVQQCMLDVFDPHDKGNIDIDQFAKMWSTWMSPLVSSITTLIVIDSPHCTPPPSRLTTTR